MQATLTMRDCDQATALYLLRRASNGGEMHSSPPAAPRAKRYLRHALIGAGRCRRCRCRCRRGYVAIDRLGPPRLAAGRTSLDHRARPQRPPAARLHHTTGPLAAAGRADATSTSATSPCCSPSRTSASTRTGGIDMRSLARAAVQLVEQPPHRLRRLDAHDAGRAPASKARYERSSGGKLRQIVGALQLEQHLNKRRDPARSTCGWRPSAATSRACARRRWPTSARSRGGCRSARRRCSSRCRNRPMAAPRPQSARPRASPATACSQRATEAGVITAGGGTRAPGRAGAASARRAFPKLAPHLAEAEVDGAAAGVRAPAHHRSRRAAGARDSRRGADQAARPQAFGGHPRRRPHHRRGDRPRRLGRLSRRCARSAPSTWPTPCARPARR